ncbi:LOW QUALITY PROTEIN: something about silencing protein 10-like [Ctenocephalides felis]|uniref:LOW QUALITY PROTEIN: something about silencing protein 10-like n=1 Tax=Ctenocephalides felis TaxID=7515 RepID=UPI000E6E4C79|nr:LOW QUALITY PROTEIN: something about silencing protein 10-like [Ctenocephalides felis]
MSANINFSTADSSDDESNSDAEYSEGVQKILSNVKNKRKADAGSEDELYAFSDSSSESDDQKIADSDIEGAEDDDLPDARAWGKRKGTYYSTDYVDQDYGGFNDEQEEKIAEQEEAEARAMQARLTKELDVLDDITLEIFHKKTDAPDEPETYVKTDISKLSTRQKQQLFLKESPEFPGLVEDFENKMEHLQKYLVPIKKLHEDGELPDSPAIDFVLCQHNLILNYCNNILFYLLLKSKRIPVQNHPVVKRLYQFRQLTLKLEPIFEEVIRDQIEDILEKFNNKDTNKKIKNKPKKKLGILKNSTKTIKQHFVAEEPPEEDTEEQQPVLPSKKMKLNTSSSESESEAESEEGATGGNTVSLKEEDGKRAITYQIAKNKGLMPKRKKEMRNPRVKHRNKFRKAKIRRKGAVREVRTETTRYGGELSGIKASVKKSIKIK